MTEWSAKGVDRRYRLHDIVFVATSAPSYLVLVIIILLRITADGRSDREIERETNRKGNIGRVGKFRNNGRIDRAAWLNQHATSIIWRLNITGREKTHTHRYTPRARMNDRRVDVRYDARGFNRLRVDIFTNVFWSRDKRRFVRPFVIRVLIFSGR